AHPNPGQPENWTLSAGPGGTPAMSGTGSGVFPADGSNDSDGDGQPDFFEFATGSDPENPASAFYPEIGIEQVTIDGSPARYVAFNFTHRPGLPGVNIVIEASGDLVQWSS